MRRIGFVALAIMLAVTLPMTTVAANGSGFSDIATHWGKGEILTAAGLGLFDGYPDGTFGPDRQITRGEFVKIAVEGLSLPAGGSVQGFTDLTGSNHWAVPYIARAQGADLIKPADFGGTFQPDKPITRAEIARIVVRGIDGEAVARRSPKAFPDRPSGDLGTFVDKAYTYEIINGYDDGTFGPNRTATRAEAGAMLLRTIKARPSGSGSAEQASEVFFVARQFMYASTLGLSIDKTEGPKAALQWATPEIVADFKAHQDGVVRGADRVGPPMLTSSGGWIAKDSGMASLNTAYFVRMNGQWQAKSVFYEFQLRLQDNRWVVVGYTVVSADSTWEQIVFNADTRIDRIYRVSDPRIGTLYSQSLAGRVDALASIIIRDRQDLATWNKVDLVSVGLHAWQEHPHADKSRIGLAGSVSGPKISGKLYAFVDLTQDRIGTFDVPLSDLAGEVRLSFRTTSKTEPLLVDGVAWNRLWRDPLMPELAGMTDGQYLANQSQLNNRLNALVERMR